jgi:DNA-binding MarR family transcriptional regulator
MEAFWGFGQIMRQHVIPSVIGEYGLDFKDFITLTSIYEGVHYPKFICERLHTNPSDVSRILETLSKGGFVKRELDEHDSRRVRVTLTEHGQQVLRLARERIHTLLTLAEGALPDDELEHFSATLVRLQHIIGQRVTELGLTPPKGDQRGMFGDWGKPTPDSS